MIENVVDYLDAILTSTGYYTKQWGYIEIVRQAEKQFPAKYQSKGKHIDVSSFNRHKGTAYFRRNGAFTTAPSESNLISCKRMVDFVLPLRLVSIIRKADLKGDNCYSSDELGVELVKLLSAKENGLKTTLKAKRVEINPSGWTTDSYQIFQEEYVVTGTNQIDPKYSYLAIDFDVRIQITRECIEDYCTGLTDCDILLGSLTDYQLINCILGWYDFSNAKVQAGVSAQQQSDLTTWLCGAVPPTAYVRPKIAIRTTNWDTYDTGYWLGLGAYDHETTIGLKKILDNNDSSMLASIVGNENEFGGYERYTNDLGGNVYDGTDGSTNDYMIDHYTGKGWVVGVAFNNRNWATAMDYIQNTLTVGVYTGFRAPSVEEYQQITTGNGGQVSAPLTNATTIFWMSNSINATTAYICRAGNAIESSTPLFSAFSKSNTSSSVYVRAIRNHYY